MNIRTCLIAVILTCGLLQLGKAAAQISVVTPPNIPAKLQVAQSGWTFSTSMTLRNDGAALDSSLVSDERTVAALFQNTGRLIPYVYRFELVNTSLGTRDRAAYVSSAKLKNPSTSTTFPSGQQDWEVFITNIQGIYRNGGNQSYALYLRAYDAKCSVALGDGSKVAFPACMHSSLLLSSFDVTWQPLVRPLAQIASLPTVTVTASRDVNYDAGLFTSSGGSNYSSSPALGIAIIASMQAAVGLANVCTSPVSSGARETSSASDPTNRWLAAQEMFNLIQAKNMWAHYGRGVSLTFAVNGKNMRGFKVWYADGVSEVWMVNPNFQFSSMKLFDEPLPGSMKANPNLPGCNKG